MENEVLEKTYALKKLLQEDERIIALEEVEKKMNESDEVMALAYRKDMANDRLNELLRIFKSDSNEVSRARNELVKAKTSLETHPLVKEYLNRYCVVRDLYLEITSIVFGEMKPNLCEKEKN